MFSAILHRFRPGERSIVAELSAVVRHGDPRPFNAGDQPAQETAACKSCRPCAGKTGFSSKPTTRTSQRPATPEEDATGWEDIIAQGSQASFMGLSCGTDSNWACRIACRGCAKPAAQRIQNAAKQAAAKWAHQPQPAGCRQPAGKWASGPPQEAGALAKMRAELAAIKTMLSNQGGRACAASRQGAREPDRR